MMTLATDPLLEAIAAAIADAREGVAPPSVHRDQTLAGDLDLSSLEVMKTALALEERLGVTIEEGAEFEISTVGDLADYLAARIAMAPNARGAVLA